MLPACCVYDPFLELVVSAHDHIIVPRPTTSGQISNWFININFLHEENSFTGQASSETQGQIVENAH